MGNSPINTGLQDLDHDLKEFFDLVEDKQRFEEAKRLLAELHAVFDGTLNKGLELTDKLKAVLPDSAIKLAVALRDPSRYQAVLDRVKDEGKPYLRQAKEIIDRDLPRLAEGIPDSAISEAKEKEPPFPEEDSNFPFTVIRGISSVPEWVGIPPAIAPAVRLAIKDERKRSLFTATLHWNHLFFMVEAVTEIARTQLEHGLFYADKGLIPEDAIAREKVAAHILKAQAELDKIKLLAQKYGIDLSKPEP